MNRSKKTLADSKILKELAPKKRISKRVYPAKECANPLCKIGFNATDKKQKYHCAQCRIDHNNDKRKIKNQFTDRIIKLLKENEAILKKIHKKISELPCKTVNRSLLIYEDFHFGISTDIEINLNTAREIEWNFHYGMEGYSKENNSLIIHYREKIPF